MTPLEWLACELVSYYSCSIDAQTLMREMYRYLPYDNIIYAERWERGERDVVYESLPQEVVQYLSLEPM